MTTALIASVLMFTAAAAQPVEDPFCSQLRRVLAAGNESPAFASLSRNHESGCEFRTMGDSRLVDCLTTEGAAGRDWPWLRDTIAACLPEARRSIGAVAGPPTVLFSQGPATIRASLTHDQAGAPILHYRVVVRANRPNPG